MGAQRRVQAFVFIRLSGTHRDVSRASRRAGLYSHSPYYGRTSEVEPDILLNLLREISQIVSDIVRNRTPAAWLKLARSGENGEMRLALALAIPVACFCQGVSVSPPAFFANQPYGPFPGFRLNDATGCGSYTGPAANHTYVAKVTAAGKPDQFAWSKDGGAFSAVVAMTGSCQILADGVGIQFAHTTGHTAGGNADQWTIQTTTATVTAARVRPTLTATDLAGVDPTGQKDSSAGLQAGIEQSRIAGRCLILPGGMYAIETGLLMTGGECMMAEGHNQTILKMTASITAVTMEGLNNKLAGMMITKARDVQGGIGVRLTGSASIHNTDDNVLDDLYVVADDPGYNKLTAGIQIDSDAAYETKWARLDHIRIQGAVDGLLIESLSGKTASNANWGTDLWLENSTRCLHIISAGENHFSGLALNGCAAASTSGSVAVSKGSTSVEGSGTAFSPQMNGASFWAGGVQGKVANVIDGTHLTLATGFTGETGSNLKYSAGVAPIVVENNGIGPSSSNYIQMDMGESEHPTVVAGTGLSGNTFVLPYVTYLGESVVDNSGLNSYFTAGNIMPGYDAEGRSQLWIGSVSTYSGTQYATFQISETGNNSIVRIQRQTNAKCAAVGCSWLNFNPYLTGLYLANDAAYHGANLQLDTNRNDAPLGGRVDFLRGGKLLGYLEGKASGTSPVTEIQLHAADAAGNLEERGSLAGKISGTGALTMGTISNGSCGHGSFALAGAVNSDFVVPSWNFGGYGNLPGGAIGTMTVSAPGTIMVTVCNYTGEGMSGNMTVGAMLVR